MEKKYIPCSGCGATNPIERCIGCFHPFESPKPIKENPKTGAIWVKASERLPGWKQPVKWRVDGIERKVQTVSYLAHDECPANIPDYEWLDESRTAGDAVDGLKLLEWVNKNEWSGIGNGEYIKHDNGRIIKEEKLYQEYIEHTKKQK